MEMVIANSKASTKRRSPPTNGCTMETVTVGKIIAKSDENCI